MTENLSTEVLIDFERSIKNVHDYATAVEGLNANMGTLEGKLNSLRQEITQFKTATLGENLRNSINQQIKAAIESNGVVLSELGDKPFRISKNTTKLIRDKVNTELNAFVASMAGDIKMSIDPSYKPGKFVLGANEMEEFNKQIGSLIKQQMENMRKDLRANGMESFPKDLLDSVYMDIGRDTVTAIVNQVKGQIRPVLLNPRVDTTGLDLTLKATDSRAIFNKIRAQLKEAMEKSVGSIDISKMSVPNIDNIFKTLDKTVVDYVGNLNKGLAQVKMEDAQVPIEKLNRKLTDFMARQLGMSTEQLNELGYVTQSDIHKFELERQLQGVSRALNNHINDLVAKRMKDVIADIKTTEINWTPNIKEHLIHQMNKLHAQIVAKVREQVDRQFASLREEVASIDTTPRTLNRNGRIRQMSNTLYNASFKGQSGGSNPTVVNNTYNNQQYNAAPKDKNKGVDRFTRRDDYFNSFGLEGAIENTIRHIIAGGIVGAPIMLIYDAINTFKETQLEFLKIAQNYMLKDDYLVTNAAGETVTNFDAVEGAVAEVNQSVKELAKFYGIDFSQMSQVAAVATRMTSSPEEALQFSDYASMIYRLDNEGDIVETIAPGLEALMGQFDKSVWEMDEAVRAFAAATNVTKATTEDLLEGLMRSGSSFNASGMTITESTMLMASALQYTGLSGSDLGNMFKTLNTRLGMVQTQNKLSEYGIDVYETDQYGRQMRRNGFDLLTEIANLVATNRIGDQALDELLQVTAGGYQIGKVRAFIESVNNIGISPEAEGAKGLNVHDLIEKAQQQTMESVMGMLQYTMNTTVMSMDRAGVAANVAMVSVIEELTPEIKTLADSIVNLSGKLEENADKVSAVIQTLINVAVGYAAKYLGSKMLSMGDFSKYEERVRQSDRIYGTNLRKENNVNSLLMAMGNNDSTNFLKERTRDNMRILNSGMNNNVLAPYIAELGNMTKERQKEIQQFTQYERGGRQADNLADFFMIMDESRGYDRNNRTRLSATDLHQQSIGNLKNVLRVNDLADVFTDGFKTAFDQLESREGFLAHSANSGNRQVMRGIASMDNARRNQFESFLSAEYGSKGLTIDSIEDLNNAYGEFNRQQQRVAENARNSSPHLRTLNDEVERIHRTSSRLNGRESLLNFFDGLQTKGKALIPTVMQLTRNLASMAGQVAILASVGEILTHEATWGALTDTQRELQLKQAEKDTAKAYLDYQESGGFWGSLTDIGAIANSFIREWNGWMNTITGEDTRVDNAMLGDFGDAFEDWLKANYGTKDFDKALNKANEGLDEGVDPLTKQDLLDTYLGDSGITAEMKELEREDFLKEYEEFANQQAYIEQMQEEAKALREAQQNSLFESGQAMGMTLGEVSEILETRLKELNTTSAVRELDALLSGVKSNSREYYDLQVDILTQQLEVYEEMAQKMRDNIKELKELYDSLDEFIIDADGNEVSNPERDELESEIRAQEETLEEFEERKAEERKRIELDRKRAQFKSEMSVVDELNANASYNDSIAKYRRDENYAEGSASYYSQEKSDILAQRAAIQETLDKLQSINPSLDIDGTLQQQIRDQKLALEENTRALREAEMNRILAYREDLSDFRLDQDIAMLQARVAAGGVPEDSPMLKSLRMNQLAGERSEIEKQIAILKSELNGPNLTSTQSDKILAEIKDLQRQSLQVQLEQLAELKSDTGTFNLPDGVKAMSYLDYVMGQNTHSNYSVQSGDMSVNIILPNVTGQTSQSQLQNIGQGIGKGITNGRLSSLRTMISGNPYAYRTY